MKRLIGLSVVALLAFGSGWLTGAGGDEKPQKAEQPERFDMTVGEDLFSGFDGDQEALDRGIRKCEEALKADPKHAEAMVWRGAARLFLAGQAFRQQKQDEGVRLWTAGMQDVDRAVELAPKQVGVRIPRGAVLISAARNVPENMKKPLLEKVRADYEAIYNLQKDHLDKLGTHPRGELHMGLAEVYRRLQETDKSREQLETVVKVLPETKYAERATAWLQAKPDADLAHNCIGCHRK